MMAPEEIEALIRAGLTDAEVRVQGDGRHFQAVVVAPGFEGKSRIQRHRMIYALLREHIDSDALHAVALQTLTPGEHAGQG